MKTCENCARQTDPLFPVVVYGGPDGEYNENWCAHCVAEECEDPDETKYGTVPNLGQLIHYIGGKQMDKDFALSDPEEQ